MRVVCIRCLWHKELRIHRHGVANDGRIVHYRHDVAFNIHTRGVFDNSGTSGIRRNTARSVCRSVHLAAFYSGINKRAQVRTRQRAGAAGRGIADHMRDDALWQIIGVDFIVQRQPLQATYQFPVPADGTAQQAGCAR